MRPLSIVLAVLVALGPLGCAHRPPAPVVETHAPEKPAPGVVAITIKSEPVASSFQRPGAIGAGQGAKEGAAVGAVAPLAPGIAVMVIAAEGRDARGVILGLMMLGAGIVLAPLGAGIGAAVGALAAPSAAEVERSAAALDGALKAANLPDALLGWILEAGGERPMIPPFAAHPDSAYPSVDTFLEIEAPEVWLTSKDPTDWEPGLRLRLTVRARLVRSSDGEGLATFTWEHEGPEARFVEWAKDDARLFREELERAGRALTARAIADLY